MHSILIFIIVAVIVAMQLKVASEAVGRIKVLKKIVPESTDFETITVYVRESQVKTISAEHILANLNKFALPKAFEDNATVSFQPVQGTPPSPITNGEIGYDTLIWVTKDGENKEIPFKLLKRHEQLGWKQIN